MTYRRMVFTAPTEYPTVCLRVTRGSSSNSWQPYAPLNFKVLGLLPDLWSSRSGTDKVGPTMQRVCLPLPPACLEANGLSGTCIYCRDLAFIDPRVSAYPHTLWFHKPQLTLGKPRHRTVLCNARELCRCSETTSAGAPRADQFRGRLERRPEKCASRHKITSPAFKRIFVISINSSTH